MNALQRLAGGAATAFALFALTAPAFAGGSIKDRPAEPRRCTFSANAALATEYVFRGFSQTAQGPAIQGGFDATCGIFYAGVWASNLDFGVVTVGGPDQVVANIEIDAYAGVKFTTGKLAWDVGIIYYGYPNQASALTAKLDYVEFKAGVSTEVWKGGTVGGTVFFSPDYTLETGNVWTLEGSFSQTLPTIFGRITPTFSALVGYQFATSDKAVYIGNITGDDSNYTYWNAGVTFGLDKNWSVDVRYWDTNISGSGAACTQGSLFACDERVVGTLKFTY
jgi:uncharacterized protein (TIGR02001 family)